MAKCQCPNCGGFKTYRSKSKSIVRISGNDYSPKNLEQPISLKPGNYTVVVKQPGLNLPPQEFTLEKDQSRIVRLYDPERKAAEWVLSVGGDVQVDAGGRQQSIKAADDLPAGPFKVTGVDLNHKQFDDAGLENLKHLKHLTSLGLHHTRTSDAGLAHLSQLQTLTVLGLSATPVGDAGLAHLKGLTNLRDLGLGSAPVSDAGLAHLKELKGLKRLGLSGTKVTDAGVAELKAALPHCNVHKRRLGQPRHFLACNPSV